METKQPALYGPDSNRRTSRRALLFPTSWRVEIEEPYGDIRTLDLTETDQMVYALQHEQVLACCGLLATEPTLVDAPMHASLTSMNVGRGRGRGGGGTRAWSPFPGETPAAPFGLGDVGRFAPRPIQSVPWR